MLHVLRCGVVPYCTMWYHIVMYCIIYSYPTDARYTVQQTSNYVVPYRIVLYGILPYYVVMYRTARSYIFISNLTTWYQIPMNYIFYMVSYDIVPYGILPYNVVMYRTYGTIHRTISCHIISYYNVSYSTM